MIEPQAGMLQERESQSGRASDARAAGAHRQAKGLDVRGAEIGQFASLEIAPEQFDGDERRVGIRTRVGLKVQAGPPTVPSEREGGGDGQPFPVRPVWCRTGVWP